MPVQSRLADEHSHPSYSRPPGRLVHLPSYVSKRILGCLTQGAPGNSRRRSKLPEDLAERLGPLAGRHPCPSGLDRYRNEVLVAVRRATKPVDGSGNRAVLSAGTPPIQGRDLLGLGGRVDHMNGEPLTEPLDQRRRLRLRETIHADERQIAHLDGPKSLSV